MKSAAAVATLIASLCAATMGGSQQSPPPGSETPQLIPRTTQERERTYQKHHRVILNVDVRDRSGAAVKGLSAADFTLLDAGRPKKIARLAATDERSAATSAHVLLVIDAMNNSPDDLAEYRRSLDRYLRSGPPPVPISLVVLTHIGFTQTPPSTDPDVLMAHFVHATKQTRDMSCTLQPGEELNGKLDELAGSPDFVPTEHHSESVAECLGQRFRIAVDSLKKIAAEQRKTAGRAIVVWLGGGWPVPTENGMRLLDANGRQRFFDQVVDLSETLRDARVTLDAIWRPGRDFDLRLAEWYRAFKGAPSREEVSRESVSLAAMAHQSGGQVFANTADIADALRTCVDDASGFYQLLFESEPAQTANVFRTIEVKVARPDVTVRYPTAYYAQP